MLTIRAARNPTASARAVDKQTNDFCDQGAQQVTNLPAQASQKFNLFEVRCESGAGRGHTALIMHDRVAPRGGTTRAGRLGQSGGVAKIAKERDECLVA